MKTYQDFLSEDFLSEDFSQLNTKNVEYYYEPNQLKEYDWVVFYDFKTLKERFDYILSPTGDYVSRPMLSLTPGMVDTINTNEPLQISRIDTDDGTFMVGIYWYDIRFVRIAFEYPSKRYIIPQGDPVE